MTGSSLAISEIEIMISGTEMLHEGYDLNKETLSRTEQTGEHESSVSLKFRLRLLRCYILPIGYGCKNRTTGPGLEGKMKALEMYYVGILWWQKIMKRKLNKDDPHTRKGSTYLENIIRGKT